MKQIKYYWHWDNDVIWLNTFFKQEKRRLQLFKFLRMLKAMHTMVIIKPEYKETLKYKVLNKTNLLMLICNNGL